MYCKENFWPTQPFLYYNNTVLLWNIQNFKVDFSILKESFFESYEMTFWNKKHFQLSLKGLLKSYYMASWWTVHTWARRFSFRLHAFPQISHMNGFAPVWTMLCRRSLYTLANVLPQCSHVHVCRRRRPTVSENINKCVSIKWIIIM